MKQSTLDALNRLTKWRAIFAGWQLGTRTQEDAESQAVRDHREVTILLRVENSALANLLVEKGIFTLDEYEARLEVEATHLSKAYERKFPGFKAVDTGIEMNPIIAADTTRNWRP